MTTMKRCTKCGEMKAPDDYYDSRTGTPASWCKQCYRDQTAAWKRAHRTPEKDREWAAARRIQKQKVKDAVFGAYGGYQCNCCGETERHFLTLDHINNDGADWRRKTLGTRTATGWQTYRWLLKHGFPPGYQVLCMNCNFGKRMNGGVCPHQDKRNDYPLVGVEPSGSKRTASDEAIH